MRTLFSKLLSGLLLAALVFCAPRGMAQFAGKKIVIDPGHGGSDPGALGVNGSAKPNEADFNLDVALRYRDMLQAAGATVIMTRTTDTFLFLTTRRDIANNHNPDVFVSIHCNAFSNSSANGTETFWHSNGTTADRNWARAVQTRMLEYLGRRDRGVKQANFTVLTANPPSCLAELLFISNQTEFNIINSESGKNNAATALYLATADYLGIDPTPGPSISSHPQSLIRNPGQTASFSVTASGGGTLSYRWRKNGANLSNGGRISGATSPTLTISNVQQSDSALYTVVVTAGGSVTSVPADLWVNAGTVLSDNFEASNLNTWSVVGGATALTSSTARNRTPGGSRSALINSSQNRMYRNLSRPIEGRFRATFWIYDDSQNRVFGEARAYAGGAFDQGGLQQLFAIGRHSTNFGTGLDGDAVNPSKYQGRVVFGSNTGWFNLNANRSSGWQKFEIERLADGATVRFYVNGVLDRTITGASNVPIDSIVIGSVGLGDASGNAWIDDARFELFDPPLISTQPASQTAAIGGSATFSVAASRNPLTYQWRRDGVNISGATSPALTINNVQGGDGGTYTVVVGNEAGSVTSQSATLTVLVPPAITTQPANQFVAAGAAATFAVSATGSAPLSYEWRFEGGAIPGATTSSYTRANAQAEHAGTYSVRVSNSAGFVVSGGALLTVNHSPALMPIEDQTVTVGGTLTLRAEASDPDSPPQTLTFSLEENAPDGASIHSESGVLNWMPTAAQIGGNAITIRVSDDGTPGLSDWTTFSVTVLAAAFEVEIGHLEDGRIRIEWEAVPGATYRVESASSLDSDEWTALDSFTVDSSDGVFEDQPQGGNRFYRVLMLQTDAER